MHFDPSMLGTLLWLVLVAAYAESIWQLARDWPAGRHPPRPTRTSEPGTVVPFPTRAR